MTIARITLAAVLFTLPAAAHAQRISKLSGDKLNALCSNARTKELCEAYISGVTDGIAGMEHNMNPTEGKSFSGATCIPTATSVDSMRSTVLAYLSDHPDLRQKPAAVASFEALHAAFPCGKSG